LGEEVFTILEDPEGMPGGVFVLSCHHFVTHFLVSVC
jgi:hypothetical protein